MIWTESKSIHGNTWKGGSHEVLIGGLARCGWTTAMAEKREEAAGMPIRILKATSIPGEVDRYLLQHWAEHLKPIKHKVIEAGLVGKSFTERSPDMSWKRRNYSFAEDGTLVFDFESGVRPCRDAAASHEKRRTKGGMA